MKRLLLVALVSASVSAQNRNPVYPPHQTSAVSITNSVTADQGAASTLSNPWPIEITMDGLFVYGVLAHPFRVDPTGVTTQPVSLVSAPLPSGAATETTLALIKAKTDNLDVALSTRTKPADSQTVTGTVTANAGTNLNTSALALDATLTGGTQKTKLVDTGGTNVASVSSGGALKVDGSAATQPVSGTVAATQSGTWTVQPGNTANTTAWKVDGSAVTQPVSGTVSANASQSGTWTVQPGNTANTTAWKVDGSAVTQPISGTVTANAGSNLNTSALALDATLTGGTQKAIARGGVKGSTTAADVTSTSTDSNHNALDVNVNNASLAVTGTFFQGTQPVSGTVTANQGGTWTVQPGNTANTTAWKVDGSAVTQPANLSQVGGNSVVTGGTNGSQGVGGLAATNATAAGNPVLVGGSDYGGTPKAQNVKVDSSGFLHATLEASTGTSNVSATQSGNWTHRTVGNAGAVLDFVGQNVAAPANSFLVGGEFNTTPTTISTGNASPLQLDSAGDLLVKVNAALPTGANTIGAVTQASGPWSSNVTQFGSSNIATGTGAGGSGVPRVTISNDSSLAANQSVNVAQVAGTNAVNGGLAGSQSIGGTAATNAAINQNPVLIGVEANSAQPTAATTGNQRQLLGSLDGALYTRLGGPILWSCGLNALAATNTQCQGTPGAGLSLYITSIIVGGNTGTPGQWTITSGTGTNCGTTNVALLAGSTAVKFFAPPSSQPQGFMPFPSAIKLPANTELCALGVATNTTNIQVSGYTAP